MSNEWWVVIGFVAFVLVIVALKKWVEKQPDYQKDDYQDEGWYD